VQGVLVVLDVLCEGTLHITRGFCIGNEERGLNLVFLDVLVAVGLGDGGDGRTVSCSVCLSAGMV